MPKKTVIANYGASNQGKTKTVKAVYHEIKKQYPYLNEQRKTVINGDVNALIEINGVIIGIESMGDPNSRLSDSLNDFLNNHCDIIIAACRTSGVTRDAVASLSNHGYRVFWAQNPLYFTKSATQECLNNVHYVSYFMKIFDDVLTGRL
jgi:hypothetical protein